MNREDATVESRVVLTVRNEVFNSFCLLTGGGFHVRIPSACTIRDLLCKELSIEEDYLRKHIQTILLNSKVVDDPDRAAHGLVSSSERDSSLSHRHGGGGRPASPGFSLLGNGLDEPKPIASSRGCRVNRFPTS
jgi:hypothetical protein